MTERTRRMDIHNMTHMSVRQLKAFAKAIAEHDLWDEIEEHLHTTGCDSIVLSFEPVQAIGQLLQRKQASSLLATKVHPIPECACNGTYHPPPNTPPHPPGDGGAGDGGPKPQ